MLKIYFQNGETHLCHLCGKIFSGNGLRAHLLSHAGIRSFICDICSKAFTDKPKLVKHMETHVRNRQIKLLNMNFTIIISTIFVDWKTKFRLFDMWDAFYEKRKLSVA